MKQPLIRPIVFVLLLGVVGVVIVFMHGLQNLAILDDGEIDMRVGGKYASWDEGARDAIQRLSTELSCCPTAEVLRVHWRIMTNAAQSDTPSCIGDTTSHSDGRMTLTVGARNVGAGSKLLRYTMLPASEARSPTLGCHRLRRVNRIIDNANSSVRGAGALRR